MGVRGLTIFQVKMLKWLIDSGPKKVLIEWETTDYEKNIFEENTQTVVQENLFVQLPKFYLRLAAYFSLLKKHDERLLIFVKRSKAIRCLSK